MKIRKWQKPLKKKYLRLLSTYRRFTCWKQYPILNLDFSIDSMLECWRHESLGEKYSLTPKKDTPINGYIYGKWVKDLSLKMWIEDINRGDFCKYEVITPLNRWWTEPALRQCKSGNFFPYTNELSHDSEF
jgi:hypothetical protein